MEEKVNNSIETEKEEEKFHLYLRSTKYASYFNTKITTCLNKSYSMEIQEIYSHLCKGIYSGQL
jgi:hypothetical protein